MRYGDRELGCDQKAEKICAHAKKNRSWTHVELNELGLLKVGK